MLQLQITNLAKTEQKTSIFEADVKRFKSHQKNRELSSHFLDPVYSSSSAQILKTQNQEKSTRSSFKIQMNSIRANVARFQQHLPPFLSKVKNRRQISYSTSNPSPATHKSSQTEPKPSSSLHISRNASKQMKFLLASPSRERERALPEISQMNPSLEGGGGGGGDFSNEFR